MHISSSGSILFQDAFLQSPCFNRLPSPTTINVSCCAVGALSTGSYLSSRDQIRSSKFLNATILDFFEWGFPPYQALL